MVVPLGAPTSPHGRWITGDHFGRSERVGWAGHDRRARDRGDRRDRFAAKAEGAEVIQIVERDDLRGRMPLERHQRAFAAHAVAVVDDRDPIQAAAFDFDADRARTGIERVLDELFDHDAGRSNDLAGGDLIAQLRGQEANGRQCHQLSPSLEGGIEGRPPVGGASSATTEGPTEGEGEGAVEADLHEHADEECAPRGAGVHLDLFAGRAGLEGDAGCVRR